MNKELLVEENTVNCMLMCLLICALLATLCWEIVKVYVEKISNCQKSNFLSAGLKPPFAGF